MTHSLRTWKPFGIATSAARRKKKRTNVNSKNTRKINMLTTTYAAPTNFQSGAKHMSKKTVILTPEQMADLQATIKDMRTAVRQLCEVAEHPGMMSSLEVKQLTMAAKSIYLRLFDLAGIDLDSVMVADRKRKS
jgi:hypothetical protein